MSDFPVLDRSRVVEGGMLRVCEGGQEFPVYALPPAVEVVHELRSALPDLQVWLMVALEYHRIGRRDDCRIVLEASELPELHITDQHGERPRVLNALAGYYMQRAAGERDPQLREDALHEVTKWTSRANRLEGHVLTSTAMALSYLISGKTDLKTLSQAESYLEEVRDDSTAATLLVRAMLHFARGEYAEALSLFGKTLRAKPDCPAAVRFALGLCYYKLDRRDVAERCFARALELDSELVEPRVALAVLKINTGDLSQVQPAMRLLQEAFKIDDSHPRVLNFFADHYVYRRDFDKVVKLAERARANAEVDRVAAEAEYHLARAWHARGDLGKALAHYEAAVGRDAENALAQFGLAQVLLHDNLVDRAVTALQAVLKRFPDDFSTLQILGTIRARQMRVDEAKELLQRAIDAEATDPDTLIEFGQLMEAVDRNKSLMAYRAALKLCSERGTEEPERLRGLQNNVAVMHHRLGQLPQALAAYRAVFEHVGGEAATPAEHVAASVTSSFNLARLFEDMERWDDARALYEAVLAKHVTYTDCYLRLSAIARARRDLDGAMRHLMDALAVHKDLPDALAMMGNLLVERGELHAAQLKFERILEKVDRNDAYALLSLGNIYYMARTDKKERKERNLKHAAESYWKVLKSHHTNLYAANGLGIVFAAEGRLGAAGEIFTRVREGTTAMGDVVVNLAHIYMGKGEFLKAVTLYESALRKHFRNSHPKLMLYLSRAYFECKDFPNALDYLRRCRSAQDRNKDLETLNFNEGLILEHKARRIVEGSGTPLTDAATTAVKDVDDAIRAFRDIISRAEGKAAAEEARAAAIDVAATDGSATSDPAAASASVAAEAAVGESVAEGSQPPSQAAAPAAKAKPKEKKAPDVLAKARDHLQACEKLLKVAEDALTRALSMGQEEAKIADGRARRERERREAKEDSERKRKEAEQLRLAELAEIAEKDMRVLREEMVHWKPLTSDDKRKEGKEAAAAAAAASAPGGGAVAAVSKKKKGTKKRDQLRSELEDLTPSATPAAASLTAAAAEGASPRKAAKRSESGTVRSMAAAAAAPEDDDDELEEWETARMNPKLSSLVESKRVREDRDKQRGGFSKRRNVGGSDAPVPSLPGDEPSA